MQAFEPQALQNILELESSGETGLVDDLILDYFKNCPSLIRSVETAADQKDFATLERAVHSLKSSSSLLGLEFVAALALEMESQARELKFDPLALADLKSQLETGCRELESFRVSRNLDANI